ncbi:MULTISPECIES: PTS sugar transporter subunit IIB [Clostridium]|uniref:PTS ascorbate transporter subunit IIB n=3 Tax=Clostridium TaxID=1485 RepID=A0A1J0GH30_9CLOT|nr:MULTISPECIES: PTS sugar transporter subunit IIB [Clostridium]APC40206.1 PTS ascorbate transporter subunit IIB [Clostridium estertheticum subsp. estertheticum]MBU3075213.1 PTS sugar transporter subunit IIB [Clostridium estertheticum]MBU3099864.1 PTS sugar transporter subunit IIB [Clostridium sp. DSM 17811]MBU3165428.1 PTS sugar transporter subunit IIB [Clostridium estertheticum]MBU3170434.1 PTS sugar transporter subunit IIB [Clostridium estertheticum]
MKVLAACGNGMGSSQMIKMKIIKVFKKLKIDVDVDHLSVGEAKSVISSFDMVFVSESLVSNFTNARSKTKIIGLRNLLSEVEIESKIREALNLDEVK